MTGFAAALVEAWQELRIHKLRVLLSLVGVAIAVASLTAAVALAGIGKQVIVEQYERDGRPALIRVSMYSDNGEVALSPERAAPVFYETAKRFGVEYASIEAMFFGGLKAEYAGVSRNADLRVVDAPYAAMHRLVPRAGRWLTPADAGNLSPTVVVDQRFATKLHLDPADLPTSVNLTSGSSVTATVVGIVQKSRDSNQPSVYMLPAAHDRWFGSASQPADASYQLWVPVAGAEEMAAEVGRAMRAELPGVNIDSSRSDYLAWGGGDPFGPAVWVVAGISGVILLLGALSLLNIALVTIQQRVREVGIRRSFGASTGRVFFSVMMESVVATFVAGAVGVVIAVGLVNNPLTAKYVLQGIDDVPPFPLGAAFLGLGVSLAVGALAGVLPAVVAARVRIIDAIRF